MRKKQLLFLLLVISLCLSLHITAFATTSNATTIVYVTRTGEKYHVRTCHYLKSVKEITLEQAVTNGYIACSYCNPPEPNFSCSPANHTIQFDENTSSSIAVNANRSGDYSSKLYASSSSSNRSNSGDGHGVFTKSDAGILFLIAVAGYGVMRLITKNSSKPQRTKRASDAGTWNMDNYRKRHSSDIPPQKTQTLNELQIPGMPDDTTLGISGLPREKNCNGTSPWGDKYTVWYSANGSKYHKFECKWHSHIPVNVVNCKREPCNFCKPTLPDLDWYYKYKSIDSAVNDSASAPSEEGAVSKAD